MLDLTAIDEPMRALIASYQAAIDAGHDWLSNLLEQRAAELGIPEAGNGVDKLCYFDDARLYVYKFDRRPNTKAACAAEAQAVLYVAAKGLPVPETHMVTAHCSRMECCEPVKHLEWEARDEAFERDLQRAMRSYEAAGIYDSHEGNYAVRRDGRIVCIDLSHNTI